MDCNNKLIQRMVIAWDSDFTKLTEQERQALENADDEIKNGETYTQDEVLEILGISLD